MTHNTSARVDANAALALAAEERAKRARIATPIAPKAERGPAAERVVLTAYAPRKNGRLSARDLPCLCGCGNPTTTPDARFLSGHDQRMRVAILRGGEVPELALPFYTAGEVMAGLQMVEQEDGEMVLVDVKRGGRDMA